MFTLRYKRIVYLYPIANSNTEETATAQRVVFLHGHLFSHDKMIPRQQKSVYAIEGACFLKYRYGVRTADTKKCFWHISFKYKFSASR